MTRLCALLLLCAIVAPLGATPHGSIDTPLLYGSPSHGGGPAQGARSAEAFSFGVAFQRDRAVPVMTRAIWDDRDIRLFDGWPSVDGLLGYDTRPESEEVLAGYQIALNWQLTRVTQCYIALVYLDALGSVSFRDAVEKLGVSIGARVLLDLPEP